MRIEHIAMYVNDLDAAKDFFVTFLGGVSNAGYYNEKTGFKSYFISFEDGARLEIMNKSNKFNPYVCKKHIGIFYYCYKKCLVN